MKRNRQVKILSIVALVLAIAGMSLGFAAFSSTLTISSSATVTPNNEDFKITIYGANNTEVYETFNYTSTDISDSFGYGSGKNATSDVASIDNRTHTISNIKAYFGNGTGNVNYIFAIVNEGKYDAYMKTNSKDTFGNYWQYTASNKCIPSEGATASLVSEACNGVWGTAYITQLSNLADPKYITDEYYKIPAGGTEFLLVFFEYSGPYADGPFDVEFEDIKLQFTTTKAGE